MNMMLSIQGRMLALLASGVVLHACGNTDAPPLGQVASAVVTQMTAGTSDADDLRAQLTPDVVAAVQEPFLLVSLPVRDASATLRAFATVDGKTDWRGGDGIAFVLADDVLIATRGLGADLFLAEATRLRAALATGSGTITRRYSHLDGENREVVTQYECTISMAGSEAIDLIDRSVVTEQRTESCVLNTGGDHAFVNSFWIGIDDGLVWQSDQWISRDIGQVVIKHIKR